MVIAHIDGFDLHCRHTISE